MMLFFQMFGWQPKFLIQIWFYIYNNLSLLYVFLMILKSSFNFLTFSYDFVYISLPESMRVWFLICIWQIKQLIQYNVIMVDRYQSLIEDPTASRKNKKNSSILLQRKGKDFEILIQQTQKSAGEMRKQIRQYRSATTSQQQQQIIGRFRVQDERLQKSRELLAKQYRSMQQKDDHPEKLLIKEHLLKTVQKQLRLDIEMNEVISAKENQLEVLTKKLQPGSEKLKNALSDLNEKRNQIIYLQQQVKECVQLLQIIGILVLQNTQKIELALDQIKKANEEVDKSLKVIERAKIRQQKSRRRKCCIIIIGLIVIIVAVGVVFGIKYLGI